MNMVDSTGLVLAGGASTRFGRDKRFVGISGSSLLARACATIRSLGLRRNYVAVEPEFPFMEIHGCRVLRDNRAHTGPMSALIEVLDRVEGRGIVVIPVDMPMITTTFLKYILDRSMQKDIVVPYHEGRIYPVVGYYARTVRSAMRKGWSRNGGSLRRWLASVSSGVLCRIETVEMERFGDPSTLLMNINTAEDLERVEQTL